MLKELAVAVSLLSEGASECTKQDTSNFACASFVSGALAGYFFLVEEAAQGHKQNNNQMQGGSRPLLLFSGHWLYWRERGFDDSRSRSSLAGLRFWKHTP